MRLMVGRGTFRISIQLMAIALSAAWSAAEYGRFATALGLSFWLVFLPTAAEKAALKIVPRTSVMQAAAARVCMRIATVPVVAVLVALVVAVALDPGSTATTYLAAAGWSSSTGLLMTVAGLHRLRGRPGLDAGAFGCAAGVVVAVTASTVVTGSSPTVHLVGLVAGMALLLAGMVVALPRAWLARDGGRPATRLLPAVYRTTFLLGTPDLLDALALSSVFLVLAASGRTTDGGPLYVALLASSAVYSFVLYQMRLHQPTTSVLLRGAGGAGGRARALAVLRASERAGAFFSGALALAWLVPDARSALLAGHAQWSYLVLVGLVVVEIGLSTAVAYAAFLLENTNSRVLTATSATAVVGLVATVLLAVALAPAFGAAGGIAAIALSAAIKASALRRMLLRQHPELVAQGRALAGITQRVAIP